MKRFSLLLMVAQVPIDFALLIVAGIAAYALRFSDWAVNMRPIQFDLPLPEYLSTLVIVSLSWLVLFALLGLYSPSYSRRFAKDIIRIILATSAGLAGIALYVLFSAEQFDSRFLIATGWGLSVVFVTMGRLIMHGVKSLAHRRGIGLMNVVIFGGTERAAELAKELQARPSLGYHVVARYAHFNTKTQIELEQLLVDECLMMQPHASEEETLQLFEYTQEKHIGFKYSADLFATLSSNAQLHPVAGVPIVQLKPTKLEGWGRVLKRLFDVVLSIVVLILTSPLLLVSALIIAIETGRPILYKNKRIGVRKKAFFAYKLRSMYVKDSTGDEFGGEEALKKEKTLIQKKSSKKGPIYKVENDPRVTPFGRFIRRYSIDEFPQFLNVLKGEMSIIGPRPHQPREVEGYQKRHKLAFNVKPGISGLAQISGRSDLTYEEEMRLDLLYIEQWSLWLDVIIFIKTPFILFKRRKAL